MFKQILTGCLVLILYGSALNAQYISRAMEFTNPVQEEDSNSIFASYSNLFYLRDYEYFNQIQTGYTLFGTWHYPRVAIQPNKWLKLEAGALMQKEFGDMRLSKTMAVFSLQIRSKKFRFLFGALEGNQSHRLIEPVMSYDKVIERPVEEGFQLKYNSKKIYADLWIDWELRQKINADYPEELTGGANFSYSITNPEKPWQVKTQLQLITPHKGGQLDTNRSAVVTMFNYAGGVAAEYSEKNRKRLLQQFRAEMFYTSQKTEHWQNNVLFRKGTGWLTNVYLRTRWNFAFLASYWQGHKFIAPRGSKIYQSISSLSGSNYTEPERQLLFLNLIYEKEVYPGFFIDCRYSPLFDLHKSTYEHAWLMLLSYRNNFRLGRLKK